MTTPDKELRECPFCGGEAAMGTIKFSQFADEDHRGKTYYAVNCISCGATTSIMGLSGKENPESAALKWNTRPSSPAQAPTAREKVLEEALKEIYDKRGMTIAGTHELLDVEPMVKAAFRNGANHAFVECAEIAKTALAHPRAQEKP